MSGHSKWNNIKRKKEKTDGAKAKIFTKVGREIAVAVKMGGGDPNNNSTLKVLIAKAKANNIPNDNIERIIKKAAGEGSKNSYENNTYEVRKTVSMVFQNPDNQLVATVVEEDVAFALENMGVPPQEIRKRVDEALKAVGMYEYRAQAPHRLSGGQKQRVAIAGVIAMMPRCVVLDEPTAMLDPDGRREVIRAVEKLRKEKQVTVILITHYMEEVIDADQVFVMDDGHIVMHGTPREIFSRVDELKSYRMDVPQVTMLAEELRKRGLDIPRGILRREELVEALCQLR